MEEKPYLERDSGGKWAIGREVGGRMIHLIEGRPTDDLSDAEDVLWAIGIAPHPKNLNRFFPQRENRIDRCPTLDLLELFAHLDRVIKEVGV